MRRPVVFRSSVSFLLNLQSRRITTFQVFFLSHENYHIKIVINLLFCCTSRVLMKFKQYSIRGKHAAANHPFSFKICNDKVFLLTLVLNQYQTTSKNKPCYCHWNVCYEDFVIILNFSCFLKIRRTELRTYYVTLSQQKTTHAPKNVGKWCLDDLLLH